MSCKTVPNMAGFITAQAGELAHFQGPPGIGKTSVMRFWAERIAHRFYPLIGSTMEPQDASGFPFANPEKKWVDMLPSRRFAELTDGSWVLLLDEITSVPYPVQAPMLGIIDHRAIGDVKLSPNLLMTLASNPPSQAVDGRPLPPPLANRMGHFRWEFPEEAWLKGMFADGKFPDPEIPILPRDWRKHTAFARQRIGTFHKRFPGNLCLGGSGIPEDPEKAAGAWPSPRSWFNAATVYAACYALDIEEDIRHIAVKAFVGEQHGESFAHWERNLDLPDVEPHIDAAIAWRKGGKKGKLNVPDFPAEADKVLAYYGSLVNCVKTSKLDKDGKTPDERWLAATDLLDFQLANWSELVLLSGQPLFSPFPGTKLLSQLSPTFIDRIAKIFEGSLC